VIVYVFNFFSSTNIYVESTENGILQEEPGPESSDPDLFEDEEDLLRSELEKIHDLENKSLDDENEDTSNLD
jgi:hypothetical protein